MRAYYLIIIEDGILLHRFGEHSEFYLLFLGNFAKILICIFTFKEMKLEK